MELKNKPQMSWDIINGMEDMSFFTNALIFDDLLIVAQKETNCFVLKTSDGLVIIDAIWPDKKVYDEIIKSIKDVGWNPEDISKLVLTHGHCDHTGCGKWIVENHNATTYLSQVDDELWRDHPVKPDRPDTFKDFNIDVYVNNGDIINCGDKNIYVYSTPGHTPGCLSYIFPVNDNGEKHMAGIFGGATPPWNNKDGVKTYLESVDYFMKVSKEMKADVALCNHTAYDSGIERINYSNKRCSYMPNIYILGVDGYQKFCELFKTLGNDALNE